MELNASTWGDHQHEHAIGEDHSSLSVHRAASFVAGFDRSRCAVAGNNSAEYNARVPHVCAHGGKASSSMPAMCCHENTAQKTHQARVRAEAAADRIKRATCQFT